VRRVRQSDELHKSHEVDLPLAIVGGHIRAYNFNVAIHDVLYDDDKECTGLCLLSSVQFGKGLITQPNTSAANSALCPNLDMEISFDIKKY
jgi:hypothetical protein